MTLCWMQEYSNGNTVQITMENVSEHKCAVANFGIFRVVATFNNRHYKNGDRGYMVYIYIPGASSSEWITLVRIRGTLLDAIKAAEDALFGNAVYGPVQYTIPAECIATNKKVADAGPSDENADVLEDVEDACPLCGGPIEPGGKGDEDNGHGELHRYWQCPFCCATGTAVYDQHNGNTFVGHEVN